MKKISTIDNYINEALSNSGPFDRVISYFKRENPKIKIKITKAPKTKQIDKFNGIIYNVSVGNYNFDYTAYDGSTQEANILLRSIGAVIDDGRYESGINENK